MESILSMGKPTKHGKPTRRYREQFANFLMWQMGLDVPEPSKNVMKRMRAGRTANLESSRFAGIGPTGNIQLCFYGAP